MTDLPMSMRFVSLPTFGGPEVMKIAEGPLPVPKEGEVLIRVEAAGVNRPDLSQRAGNYPPPPGASPVLGLEVTGRIVKGSGRWSVGDRVAALAAGGGYAEYCAVPSGHCLPVADSISAAEAGGFAENYFTVWANVFQMGKLKAGDRFLVHGGSSGIGTAAIQLARVFGAEVFATAGSPEKCRACESLGAKAIHYKTLDFGTEIQRLTEGRGVDIILDMVGGSYTAKNIDCLAKDGRLLQIATQKGKEVTIDLVKVMQKRAWITGSTLRPRTVEEKNQIGAALAEKVAPLWAEGRLKVLVDKTFPLANVVEAHRYLEEGQHIGKVILTL